MTEGLGRLAHINDYPEQEFLNWVLKSLLTNTSDAVYAGMTYSAPNVMFYSDSGSPDETTYPDGSIWAEGYPVSGGVACVGLVYNNPTWEWLLGNVDCDVDRAYICEITQGRILNLYAFFTSRVLIPFVDHVFGQDMNPYSL